MKEKISIISILANVVLAGGKISIGVFSGSAAILAEGIHSFMDIFSSVVGYIGIKISTKPEDQKHPYGHYKFEVLAGVIITLILLVTGIGIIWGAYNNFLNPEKIEVGYLAFGIMIFSAAVNEVMARLKIYFGKKENSIALLSDGLHSRVDVFASLVVFVGLALTKYWIFIDSGLALLIGLYIVKESFSLGKEAVNSLLDVSAGPEIEEEIKKIIIARGIEVGVVRTQKKGSAVTANLEVKIPSNLKVEEATKISEDLRKELMEKIKSLSYVAIQIKSHNVETGFYKPVFGKGFGWQRQGPGGYCVCPKCDYKAEHRVGTPCSSLRCPKCNINLERK